MNINFPNSTSSGSRVEERPARTIRSDKSAQGVGNSESQPAVGNSEVSLSDTSVTALKAQLGNLPGVRQDRVSALRQAIHNGSYQINSRQLADAIQSDLFGPSNSGS